MKVLVRSKFLGRKPGTCVARRRRGVVVASNESATQFKVAVEGLPFNVWIKAKDVKFL